jgi:hypothetical protein
MTRAAPGPVAERSYEPLTDNHLARLADIARADREDRFTRRPRWEVYRDRVLLVTLCQGAALHYLDGRNGVKDLDVWTFYAHHPEGKFPARWRVMADFGPSPLGRHPDDDGFVGRHVDLIGRSIDATPGGDPVRAVQTYLRAGGTESARLLAGKAVVALDPPELLGTTVWPS